MATTRLRHRSDSTAGRSARLEGAEGQQLELAHLLTDALIRRVNDDAERADRRSAEDLWDQGTLLNEAVAMFGTDERVAARFVEGREAAFERMRMARVTTRWLAGVYGAARMRLGLRLLELLGLSTLVELESVDLPALGPDGQPARFPATREALASAVAALEERTAVGSATGLQANRRA